MRNIKSVVIDIIKSLVLGILTGMFIAAIFFFVGFLKNGFKLYEAVKLARTAAIVIGALEMILSAGLILKRQEIRYLKDIDGWRKIFSVLSFVYVILIMSYGIIFVGGILDIILFNIDK